MLRDVYWNVGLRYGEVPARWREIEAFRRLEAGAARRALGERLLAQVRHFGARADALPEWREAARLPDAEALWAAWPSLPVVTKEDLRTRFHPERLRASGVRGRVSSTGGSTGEPTPFLHDAAQQAYGTAAGLYCWHRFGWRPGMPVVCVWGAERDIGRQRSLAGRAQAWLRNYWLVDGYALNPRTVDQVLALLDRFEEVVLYGFTSMLEFVAREVLRRGARVPPGRIRAAWNGGEMLHEHQAALFREAFGTPLLNLYGGRELGAMAFQPGAGQALEVLRPWVYVEVVDEAGRPSRPGEVGRLVWTHTAGRGTPFLRYDVGDLGVAGEDGTDASGIHHLSELHGRSAGLLHLPNGTVVNGLYWNHLFKEYAEVEQFQVAWIGGQRLEVRLRGAGLPAVREAEIRRVIGTVVGGDVPVQVRWVDRIPPTAQGKLMQLVRE
ncbi:AMP-binding protein [Longimicrobium sp.]|uniref:AMP-binding protein n=1 Tax=Longimicrobium sp. TaxID=2029185 RepID=UPI002E347916|nr:AMP-binding protein [Longimicrobium sp.]HEX6039719.1 AMP-binding protein [Longimicrobium sp.]